MTALIVIAAVMAFIAALMFTDVSFRVVYGEQLKATLNIGIFRKVIYPAAQKKLRLRDYSIKSLKKRRMKASKAALKRKKKTPVPSKQPETAKKRKIGDAAGMVRFYARVVKALLSKLGHHARVKINRFTVTVSTDDAAQTAIIYGYASQAASYLFAFLESNYNLFYAKDAPTYVNCDFTSGKTSVGLDIELHVRVWQLLSVAVTALTATRKQPA